MSTSVPFAEMGHIGRGKLRKGQNDQGVTRGQRVVGEERWAAALRGLDFILRAVGRCEWVLRKEMTGSDL